MELKYKQFIVVSCTRPRSNRTFMELKSQNTMFDMEFSNRSNRTFMELKFL